MSAQKKSPAFIQATEELLKIVALVFQKLQKIPFAFSPNAVGDL